MPPLRVGRGDSHEGYLWLEEAWDSVPHDAEEDLAGTLLVLASFPLEIVGR
jgi:hypothetical protein